MRRVAILLPLVALMLGGCKKDELEAALAKAEAELAQTRKDLEGQKQANATLQAENQTLQERIAELEGEIVQLTDQIKDLADKAGITERELAELRAEKAKREKELEVYRNLFASLKKSIDAGTIKVGFHKGRLVVQLDDAILFDSGRAKLKPTGQEAIQSLVEPLKGVQRLDRRRPHGQRPDQDGHLQQQLGAELRPRARGRRLLDREGHAGRACRRGGLRRV
jgi:chemotaxis protein MotB